MWRRGSWVLAVAVVGALAFSGRAWGVVIAADDASDAAAYNGNWPNGSNGGNGFGTWAISNNSGSGSGGGFLASNNGNNQIGTGGSANAFGLFGNGGGVGQAVRSFSSPLGVGDSFFIDMDNGSIEVGGTVGLGLQNSSGNNLIEFFFVGGQSNYTVNASNVSLASGSAQGFTSQGLRLEFHLTSATSLSVLIDRLHDGSVDATYTADLFSPAGGQAIAQLRLFNANANGGGDHDAFFNNLAVTSAVPESSAFWFAGLSSWAVGVVWYYRRVRGNLGANAAA